MADFFNSYFLKKVGELKMFGRIRLKSAAELEPIKFIGGGILAEKTRLATANMSALKLWHKQLRAFYFSLLFQSSNIVCLK